MVVMDKLIVLLFKSTHQKFSPIYQRLGIGAAGARFFTLWFLLASAQGLVMLSVWLYAFISSSNFLSFVREFNTILASVAAIIALIVGAALSAWKAKDVASYAISEVIFGFSVAWSCASRTFSTGQISDLLALIAATYVISRGFGNLPKDVKA